MSDRKVFPGIWVDPKKRFGEPRVVPSGIECAAIIARFVAGETVYDLQQDYGVRVYEIEAALRWGCLSRAKRARLLRVKK